MWDTNAEMSLYWMPAEYYFDNITGAQMFITGSVGAAADGECFYL